MKLQLEPADLEGIAELVTERVLARLAERAPAPKMSKMFVSEGEAADLLGVSAWTLKRARLHGEFSAATASRPILYDQECLDRAAQWVRRR